MPTRSAVTSLNPQRDAGVNRDTFVSAPIVIHAGFDTVLPVTEHSATPPKPSPKLRPVSSVIKGVGVHP